MLLTLHARAEHTLSDRPRFSDPAAVELVSRLDYDFTMARQDRLMADGVVLRTLTLDPLVAGYLATHPGCTVVNIACGLDTRFQRLDDGRVTWYDLDLPEAIELRRKLLQETDENTFLAQSLFDYSWCDKVKATGKPTLIIIEGVMMYFEPKEVQSFFSTIAQRLDNAVVLFDMLAFALVGNTKKHDSLKKMGKEVEFKWSMLNTKDMETWNNRLHLAKEYYMSDYDHGRFPFIFRMLYHIPYFYRRFNQRVVKLKIGD